MALISCPECTREVSDQAAACPHCGYPLHTQPPATSPVLGDTDARLTQALLTQGKIAAIKLCRELYPDLGLAEAKARVDRLEANLPAGSGPRVGGGGCLLVVAALLLAAGCWGSAFL